ncbi:hypothetical protein CYY_009034 [Polysphondylium violaceum]|uniref:Paramecium surface antigen repeat-containing protein n=1 Tax=Polysphondylium violaceum TaxID=133409 RepID=A0A8J4PPK0_9MYCE|nr:hypothetical protein CYY_009034 [Polysphondylium violaceum]
MNLYQTTIALVAILSWTIFNTTCVVSQFNNSDISCSLNSCSQLGGPCSENQYSGFQCYVENRCSDMTCVQSIQEGFPCNKSSDCTLETSCILDTEGVKRCVKAFYLDAGANCTYSYECTNSQECVEGICNAPPSGCISDLQCLTNQICINGTCTDYQLQENECFIYSSAPCPTIQPCTLKNGTDPFKQTSIGVCLEDIPVGNPCLVNKFSCDWNSGQYCDPISEGSTYGHCVVIPPPTFTTCITQDDCQSWEFCKCDSQSGVGYCSTRLSYLGKYCRQSALLFFSCFLASGCANPFQTNPASCIFQACPEETNCFISYCTEPMLPVDICVERTCKLSIFNTSARIISLSSRLSPPSIIATNSIVIGYLSILILSLLYLL